MACEALLPNCLARQHSTQWPERNRCRDGALREKLDYFASTGEIDVDIIGDWKTHLDINHHVQVPSVKKNLEQHLDDERTTNTDDMTSKTNIPYTPETKLTQCTLEQCWRTMCEDGRMVYFEQGHPSNRHDGSAIAKKNLIVELIPLLTDHRHVHQRCKSFTNYERQQSKPRRCRTEPICSEEATCFTCDDSTTWMEWPGMD